MDSFLAFYEDLKTVIDMLPAWIQLSLAFFVFYMIHYCKGAFAAAVARDFLRSIDRKDK